MACPITHKEFLMKVLFSWRHVRLFVLALLSLTALVAFSPLQYVNAKGPNAKNRIVRNDGATFALPKSTRTISPSHAPSANTGEIKPQTGTLKNLPPLRPGSPESVIGPDGRTQVTNTADYPNRAIAHLEVTFPSASGTCTGWFIDVNRLATAAHCVYDGSAGGWATSIVVYPGRSGATEPYGHVSATNFYTVIGWVDTANPKWDYAVIKIGSNVGSTVGWFGYGWNGDNSFLQDRKVTVRGYPGDKPYGTMWTMKGPIQTVQTTRFFYSIDTFGGQSGSPVYGKWTNSCNPCSFGIHTYGVGGSWTKNSATRITKKVFKFLDTAGVAP